MIVFGSRGSDLALVQTRAVAATLRERTGEEFRVEVLETRGDQILDQPLPAIGGKGLFTAELEAALLAGRIDAAVHSMKDLPVEVPAGLAIGAVPPRVVPTDVLVCAPAAFDAGSPQLPLRRGCRVGTSSHRRRAALAAMRPDLQLLDVRGNVPTRVDKVRRGLYDAVVLAAAGLERLRFDFAGLKVAPLAAELCPPAPAQGALAVQCRADDRRVRALLSALHDEATAQRVHAERELLLRLGGGCSMPLGALVTGDAGAGFRLQVALFANPVERPEPGPGVFLELRGPDPRALAVAAAQDLQALVAAPLRGLPVVLLRPEGGSDDLARRLHVAGAEVRTVALTRVVPLPHRGGELQEHLRERALCFTSARAVDHFGALADGIDVRAVPVFAGGPATAAAVRARGWACESPVDGSGGAALARLIAGRPLPRRGVLFPCAEERHGDLEAGLAAARIDVLALPLYRTEPLGSVEVPLAPGTAVVFTSPSAAKAWAAQPRPAGALCVALGPTTASAMQQCGIACAAVSAGATAADLVRCLEPLRHA
jgi:hydroxymethylbilane synthase